MHFRECLIMKDKIVMDRKQIINLVVNKIIEQKEYKNGEVFNVKFNIYSDDIVMEIEVLKPEES